MSIPPISAIGAAISAAKVSSALAADLVETATEKMEAFADVLSADSVETPAGEVGGDSDAFRSAAQRVSDLVDELKDRLGISFSVPITIQLEEDGHVRVDSGSDSGGPLPGRSSLSVSHDIDSRMKLQAYLNGDEEARKQIAEVIGNRADRAITIG